MSKKMYVDGHGDPFEGPAMIVPEQALLPCPFCGGEAELITPTETDRWAQVNCKACGCRGTEYPAETSRAVAAWNRRAPALMGVQQTDAAPLPEFIDRQRKKLTEIRGNTQYTKGYDDALSAVERVLALPAQSGSGVEREDVAARSLSLRDARLIHALKFYADPKRYCGANQRVDVPDEYQPVNKPYLLDVTRDGGRIARDALAAASLVADQRQPEMKP